MKKIIFAVMLLLVLGGGAVGAYFYFGKPAEASVGDSDEHIEAKEASGKNNADKANAEYVELDPLILPIIDNNGVSQVISLVVVIEVGNTQDAETIIHNQPRLKDAYIQELYGVLNKHAALRGGVVQVDRVKERLKGISYKVMGDDMITDVLLQVVQQRPM